MRIFFVLLFAALMSFCISANQSLNVKPQKKLSNKQLTDKVLQLSDSLSLLKNELNGYQNKSEFTEKKIAALNKRVSEMDSIMIIHSQAEYMFDQGKGWYTATIGGVLVLVVLMFGIYNFNANQNLRSEIMKDNKNTKDDLKEHVYETVTDIKEDNLFYSNALEKLRDDYDLFTKNHIDEIENFRSTTANSLTDFRTEISNSFRTLEDETKESLDASQVLISENEDNIKKELSKINKMIISNEIEFNTMTKFYFLFLGSLNEAIEYSVKNAHLYMELGDFQSVKKMIEKIVSLTIKFGTRIKISPQTLDDIAALNKYFGKNNETLYFADKITYFSKFVSN